MPVQQQPQKQQQQQQADQERPSTPALGELSRVWRVSFLRAEIVDDFWCGKQHSQSYATHARNLAHAITPLMLVELCACIIIKEHLR